MFQVDLLFQIRNFLCKAFHFFWRIKASITKRLVIYKWHQQFYKKLNEPGDYFILSTIDMTGLYLNTPHKEGLDRYSEGSW